MFDAEILSRIQFALSISFHIIFPTLNLGLAFFLVVVEGTYLKTGNKHYLAIARFWTKIFALTFGMGVVSGIVMSYQIGTNFGPFSNAVGPILGPLFAYEVLTAFFLEAGFLGVMLFGWDKVSPKMHFTATSLVWIGTTISAFWILSANSWMQTPSGYSVVNGQYIANNWLDVIFNPSFIPRFIHMMLAAYVTTSFVLMGISAYHIVKHTHAFKAKTTFKIALIAALVFTPLQVFVGDAVGLKVLENQPIKTAAMEGLWETTKGAPLVLFAYPDSKQENNQYEIAIPKLASLINTHQLNGEMVGLKSVSESMRPNVPIVFYGFRVMVGLGLLFIGLSYFAAILYYRKKLFQKKWLMRLFMLCTPLGFIATLSGWYVAEVGRQPWVVYGLMTTKQAVSKVDPEAIIISLILFIMTYCLTFSAYLYYLIRFIRKGPSKNVKDMSPPDYTYMTEVLEYDETLKNKDNI
tara:strand:- start:748 stop:2142 length:1395 start_codon:yes stop_codon:yes gene_type:complete